MISASVLASRMGVNSTIMRNFIWARNDISSIIHNTLFSGEHPSAIGLDITVNNKSTNALTLNLDGVKYVIPSGSILSMDNTPYIAVEVSGGSPFDVYISGVYIDRRDNVKWV